MREEFAPVSEREDYVGRVIVNSAYAVHRALGPGLLENIYETCFCHELHKRGLSYEKQVVVPIIYDGLHFDEGFRLDVMIDGLIVCELKAVDKMQPIFHAQLLTYLKLTQHRLGYLINFSVPLIKDGIQRIVL